MALLDLKDIDLNLLVVFDRLLFERSVSRAADSLGITQPAVSNALARLRKVLGDELFLRTPRGMEPTPFAEQLAESVTYALGMIHSALNQRQSFDPAASDRAFQVCMTDIGEIDLLPALMQRLAKVAPQVRISTVRNTAVNLKDEMEAGHVDLAIGFLPQLKAGFFQRRLFVQKYVCLMRKGHPLDRKSISLAAFSEAEHLSVVSPGTGHGRIEELLERKGVQLRVRLTVPHFVAIGHILSGSDLVVSVPERLAQRMTGPFGLSQVPHPARLPEIAINLFWHAKQHKDPGNQWLRGLIFGMFGAGEAKG